MRLFSVPRLAPALLLSLLATRGSAALVQPITWGTATNISGDSDVVTTGSLVTAVNFGATGVSATTVNGVTFSAFGVTAGNTSAGPTLGVRVQESPGSLVSSNSLTSGAVAFSSLSSAYKTLLGSAVGANIPVTMTITLSGDGTSGLVVGRQYLLQAWVNLSAANEFDFFKSSQVTFKDFGSTPATRTLDVNTSGSNATGGLGQWVTGTFTAAATSAQFKLDAPTGYPVINALQLRDITAVTVPESASLVWLLGPSIGAFVGLRRRGPRR